MKRLNHQYNYSIVIVLLLFTFASCKKDYLDPSGPSSEQAYSSPGALANVASGLQNIYSTNRTGLIYTSITASSLMTGETYVTNPGNSDENQLFIGGDELLNTNVVVTGMWTVANKIVYEADSVIRQTNRIVTDKGYASGIIAYASIFKALAIGNMAMFWDHVPDTIGRPDLINTDVNFITSQQGYVRAVGVLDYALSLVAADAISSEFMRNIPAGVDIVNTLYALKARYALFAGDYATALAAADNVNLSVKSTFNYNAQVTNPIYILVAATGNIYQVVDSTMGLPDGLEPDLADKREPFYISIKDDSDPGPRFRMSGFYTGTEASIPVYLPGEITLIKAECYARNIATVPQGLIELNKVVTKAPAADPFGVGADLPAEVAATQGDLLTLIYKHRRIELFMSGLALEDERRFGRPVTERSRSYFPFPFAERNDNPNTPDDPTF